VTFVTLLGCCGVNESGAKQPLASSPAISSNASGQSVQTFKRNHTTSNTNKNTHTHTQLQRNSISPLATSHLATRHLCSPVNCQLPPTPLLPQNSGLKTRTSTSTCTYAVSQQHSNTANRVRRCWCVLHLVLLFAQSIVLTVSSTSSETCTKASNKRNLEFFRLLAPPVGCSFM
jgi:hypothetical protein